MKTAIKILSAAVSEDSRGKRLSRLAGYGAVALALVASQAVASDREHHEHHKFKVHSQILVRPLDVVNFSDGVNYDTTIKFTTGIGSGAYHYPGDDRNTVYTIGDRGVNIKCSEDVAIIGADICEKGKIFPVVNYTPSIFKLHRKKHQGWKIVEVIQIKDANGQPVTGLPNPYTSMATEKAYDIKGQSIKPNANGLDTEAMV
ncbi:hypothetical protein MNBD_GAMMA24-1423, partial [hydrothermal vent metagenome]